MTFVISLNLNSRFLGISACVWCDLQMYFRACVLSVPVSVCINECVNEYKGVQFDNLIFISTIKIQTSINYTLYYYAPDVSLNLATNT